MEGVTDAPMRETLTANGGFGHCVTEFLRVCGELLPAHVFHRMLPELANGCLTSSGVPVQLQLLGGNAEMLGANAARAVELGVRSIDLNFGCPAPTVNRHDGGAVLLREPRRIRAIVEAVRSAVPREIPVSAKLRLGWDDPSAIHENAERAAEGGAAWLTIHGRTRMAGYAPPALWGPIGQVRSRLRIPVVANGDLWSLEDLRRCRGETGCDHFMLGRAALADPWLPGRALRELREGALSEPVAGLDARTTDPRAWRPILGRYAEACSPFQKPSGYAACRIKQWTRVASTRLRVGWFDAIRTSASLEEIFARWEALQCP